MNINNNNQSFADTSALLNLLMYPMSEYKIKADDGTPVSDVVSRLLGKPEVKESAGLPAFLTRLQNDPEISRLTVYGQTGGEGLNACTFYDETRVYVACPAAAADGGDAARLTGYVDATAREFGGEGGFGARSVIMPESSDREGSAARSGSRASGVHISADTDKLREYARRLTKVNKQAQTVQDTLSLMYWKTGNATLWEITRAGITEENILKLKQCISYLCDTAEDFDECESRLINRL